MHHESAAAATAGKATTAAFGAISITPVAAADTFVPPPDLKPLLEDASPSKRRAKQAKRAEIFNGTKEICRQRGYVINGKRITWSKEEVVALKEHTAIHIDPDPIPPDAPRCHTEISVVNADAFDIAKGLIDEERRLHPERAPLRPIILNMANRYSPGGGVDSGSGAQEESLFRCSNLYESLGTSREADANPGLVEEYRRKASQMGMDPAKKYGIPEHGVLVSSGVRVFRNAETEGFSLREEPFLVDVVSCPAYARSKAEFDAPLMEGYIRRGHDVFLHTASQSPVLLPDIAISETRFREGMEKKIKAILRAAYHNGSNTIVLGALGCGAFDVKKHGAPLGATTTLLLELFPQILRDPEFAGVFQNITFAVLDRNNAMGLFEPFYGTLHHL